MILILKREVEMFFKWFYVVGWKGGWSDVKKVIKRSDDLHITTKYMDGFLVVKASKVLS